MNSKASNRKSLSYITKALQYIGNEEKQMAVRSRLTNMQKNRIALKYIQFREN